MDTSILRRNHDLLCKMGKVAPSFERADPNYIIEDYEIHILIHDRSERGMLGTTSKYIIRYHYPIDHELLCELEQKIIDHDEAMEAPADKERELAEKSDRKRITDIIKNLKIENKKVKQLTK